MKLVSPRPFCLHRERARPEELARAAQLFSFHATNIGSQSSCIPTSRSCAVLQRPDLCVAHLPPHMACHRYQIEDRASRG